MEKSTYLYIDKTKKSTSLIIAGGPAETGNGCEKPLNVKELTECLECTLDILSRLPDDSEITRIDLTY